MLTAKWNEDKTETPDAGDLDLHGKQGNYGGKISDDGKIYGSDGNFKGQLQRWPDIEFRILPLPVKGEEAVASASRAQPPSNEGEDPRLPLPERRFLLLLRFCPGLPWAWRCWLLPLPFPP